MWFLNLLIAVFTPVLSGLLVEAYRKNRVYQGMLRLPDGDREEVALRVGEIVEEGIGKDLGLVSALGVSTILLNLALASHPIGYMIAGVIGPGLFAGLFFRDIRRRIRRGSREGALKALQNFLLRRPAVTAEGVMQGLTTVPDEKLQVSVTNRALNWASPWSLKLLRASQKKSPYAEVRQVSKNLADSIRKLLDAVNPRKIKDVKQLVHRGGYWQRLGLSNQGQSERKLLLAGATTPSKEEDPVYHAITFQDQLLQEYPHVYCLNCGTRTQVVDDNLWRHVICVTCLEANDLLPGVKMVVGHIGQQVDPLLSPEGVLPVNLWNPVTESAKPVDMDRLVISPGGDFNYDWAVSAALEAIRNRFPDKEFKVHVEVQAGVSLSTNTLNLLRSISTKDSELYLHSESTL